MSLVQEENLKIKSKIDDEKEEEEVFDELQEPDFDTINKLFQ